MEFREELTQRATEYFNSIEELKGLVPSPILVDFAIEKYKKHRNLSAKFKDEVADRDMRNNMATIAMAIVDLQLKVGAEGETSHSDSGVSRQYENAYISNSIFKDILPLVTVP